MEKERRLGQVNQQLGESEQLIADFGKRNTDLEGQLSVLRNQLQKKSGGAKSQAVDKASIKLRWREGEKAPCEMSRSCDTVVDNNTAYCKCDTGNKLYAYHIRSSNWSPLPECPTKNAFSIAVIDSLLTTIGGFSGLKYTNKLFSLAGEGSGRRWTEKFPPMPSKRHLTSALCMEAVLIVAGGAGDDNRPVKTVEVLNIETRQWHVAPDLPQPMSSASLTLSGEYVYLLGGVNKDRNPTNSVYSCSLSSLLLSSGSKSLGRRPGSTLTWSSKGIIWNGVADLPVVLSTAVTLHGRPLAIGGKDRNQTTNQLQLFICTNWPLIPGKPSVTWQHLEPSV